MMRDMVSCRKLDNHNQKFRVRTVQSEDFEHTHHQAGTQHEDYDCSVIGTAPTQLTRITQKQSLQFILTHFTYVLFYFL